jgi:hypothetical protein
VIVTGVIVVPEVAQTRLSWCFLLNTSGEVQNLKNTLTKLFLNVMVNFINNKKHDKQTN